MNTPGSIKHLSRLINSASSVILTTADLDGDSVGTLVALHDLIGQLNPRIALDVVLETNLPERYAFLMPAHIQPRIANKAEDWSDVQTCSNVAHSLAYTSFGERCQTALNYLRSES